MVEELTDEVRPGMGWLAVAFWRVTHLLSCGGHYFTLESLRTTYFIEFREVSENSEKFQRKLIKLELGVHLSMG